MTPIPEPDPALLAAVSARATARHAHHEAGHAVAVIVRGGTLLGVWLGSTDDDSADIQGTTRHDTAWGFDQVPDTGLVGGNPLPVRRKHGQCAPESLPAPPAGLRDR